MEVATVHRKSRHGSHPTHATVLRAEIDLVEQALPPHHMVLEAEILSTTTTMPCTLTQAVARVVVSSPLVARTTLICNCAKSLEWQAT
jgi:hypothetical protein